MKKILFIVLCCFLCVGCGDNKDDSLVSYIEAKEMIINEGAVLLDVRTREEYDEEHIDGAILLGVDFIEEETVKDLVSDKETKVIVYCQSGNRSSQAKTKLEDLGYKNVYDLGSIDNWEE